MTKLTLRGDRFMLRAGYEDRHACKEIPGRKWEQAHKCWSYPAAPSSVREIMHRFPNVEIHPSAQALVEQFKKAAQTVRALKDQGWQTAEALAPMPLKVEPFRHQVLGFNIGIQIPNVALLMEMGTGKTVTAIAIVGRRYLDGYVRRVLVVAPTSVVPVWPAEFAAFADYPHVVEVYEGEKAKRKRKHRVAELDAFFDPKPGDDRLHVLVTNIESIANNYKEIMQRFTPEQVIVDESQRIKNPSASRSKAMHYIGEKAKHKMILTGTPVTQAPLDFFSQYKFLEPSIFGTVFASFRAKYAMMGGFDNREIVGFRQVEDLERRAHSVAYRVRKDDCLDLPGSMPAYRLCELEPAARKLYDQVASDAVAEIEGSEGGEITVNNVLTKIMRLQQIAGGYVNDDDGVVQHVSSAKMKLLEAEIDNVIGEGNKCVVFARFRPEIEAIVEHLERKGIRYSRIWGDTKRGEVTDPVTKESYNPRKREVEQFQTDPERKVFVAQIQTAGLGITLTAASVNIFYSYSHNFGDYDQALARTDRIGQTKKVTNVHLLANETADPEVLRALRRKRNVADCVVDGKWRDLIEGRAFVPTDAFAPDD